MSPDITTIVVRFSQDQFVENYMVYFEEIEGNFINSLAMLIFMIG